jgi:hypothetical protein
LSRSYHPSHADGYYGWEQEAPFDKAPAHHAATYAVRAIDASRAAAVRELLKRGVAWAKAAAERLKIKSAPAIAACLRGFGIPGRALPWPAIRQGHCAIFILDSVEALGRTS